MQTATAIITIFALALLVYHHVLWPLILKRVRPRHEVPSDITEDKLPYFTLIMPAFNEAAFIEEKVRNLAALDYPVDRLQVVIACDGCTDDTVALARRALGQPELAHLSARAEDLWPNRGILGVFNHCIAPVPADRIVALTDVTAVLPTDALRKAAAHYVDPTVGVVGGAYCLGPSGYAGETAYWHYQTAVKRGEAALGAPLGLHGSFYTFRRAAWAPTRADTINDDFVMPVEMLRRGWAVRYDARIVAVEDEASDAAQDARRRRRIAAGNAQQLARNLWLLHPRYGGVALAFLSGKALRVAMPFLILLAIVGSFILAPSSPLFFALAVAETATIAAAGLGGVLRDRAPHGLAVLHYVAAGHVASLRGVLDYGFGRKTLWGTRPTTLAAPPST